MKLTIDSINKTRTARGAFTRETIRVFNEILNEEYSFDGWTLHSGWVRRLVGQEISLEQYARATAGSMVSAKFVKKGTAPAATHIEFINGDGEKVLILSTATIEEVLGSGVTIAVTVPDSANASKLWFKYTPHRD